LNRFFYSFLVIVDSVPGNPVVQSAVQNAEAEESIIVTSIDTKEFTDGDAKSTSSDEKGNKCGNTYIFLFIHQIF
jgi:hypothetical protein